MFKISRQKLVGIGRHWGIELPDERVVHFTNNGIQITSSEDFAQGRDVQIESEVPPQFHNEVIRRINLAIQENKPYDGAKWNCETFANSVTSDKAESQQVQSTALISGLSLALFLMSKL